MKFKPELTKFTPRRFGDFQLTKHIRGIIYEVSCVHCGLSGQLSANEFPDYRKDCPKCNKLPAEQWRINGFIYLTKATLPTPRPLPAAA